MLLQWCGLRAKIGFWGTGIPTTRGLDVHLPLVADAKFGSSLTLDQPLHLIQELVVWHAGRNPNS